jgi:hypothetical protein
LASTHIGVSHATARGGTGTSHAIKGHYTKSGTYVAPTRATNPNHSQTDNYSAKGNFNPYSGKVGTKPVRGVSASDALSVAAAKLATSSSTSATRAPTYSPSGIRSTGATYAPATDASAGTAELRSTAPATAPALGAGTMVVEERPTARCADGSMTFSQNKSIACGTRGGVGEWLR